MLKNYFKIAFRTFRKDKSFTAINVLGLASGLAITLMIVQYVRYEKSYENGYPNADRIVRITTDYLNGETVIAQDCETYPVLSEALKNEIPEVENSTRAYPIGEPSIDIQIGLKQYTVDKVMGVDPSFFDIFHYTLIQGSNQDLFTKPHQAVLSESIAKKYFNTIDVFGETFKIIGPNLPILMNVVGVVPDSPSNTHLKFDLLVSYKTLISDFGETEDNADGNNTLTYVELAENADYGKFTENLVLFNKQLKAQGLAVNNNFIGQKIGDIHLYSKKGFETEPNGDARSVYFLLAVAFLVIISALVNYTNLSTSKALDRAKEMGMRKVVGSTGLQIKIQVFVESLIMNVFSALLAIMLIALVENLFIETAGLPESFSIFGNLFFWACLVGFLIMAIVLSSIYPAFVLSSFKPSQVLKGSFSHSGQGVFLRKSLVVFQFGITVVLLVQTFAVYLQIDFLRNLDIGVNTEKIVVVKTPSGEHISQSIESFKQSLLANSAVKSVATAMTVPGLSGASMSTTTGINLSDTEEKTNFNFYLTSIDTSFLDLMEIELLAGENFSSTNRISMQDTVDRQFIVNEKALHLWGISDPQMAIGKSINFWGLKSTIRGVVKNYNQESPKAAQIPILMGYSPNSEGYISVKFAGENPAEQLAMVKQQYETSFPYKPFSYFFLDQEYDRQYKADERFQKVFGVLTLFAIFIACLGLFGLATFTVAKRTKEIGVRKVIGGSTTGLLVLLSKDFIKTVLISMAIGIPVTYFIVKEWLGKFANHIELSWWLFAIPALAILILTVITIGGKTLKTALMNPVESLRSE